MTASRRSRSHTEAREKYGGAAPRVTRGRPMCAPGQQRSREGARSAPGRRSCPAITISPPVAQNLQRNGILRKTGVSRRRRSVHPVLAMCGGGARRGIRGRQGYPAGSGETAAARSARFKAIIWPRSIRILRRSGILCSTAIRVRRIIWPEARRRLGGSVRRVTHGRRKSCSGSFWVRAARFAEGTRSYRGITILERCTRNWRHSGISRSTET